MAYLDLENAFTALRGACTRARGAVAIDFSALERDVIALARRDGVGSLARPGLLSRALHGIFGVRPASPLADPRLEALRRLAVHAWRRGFALPVAEIDRFLAAGFAEAQIETLVEIVTGLRVARAAA